MIFVVARGKAGYHTCFLFIQLLLQLIHHPEV